MSVLPITPKVYVDWSDNGNFAQSYEDVSAYVLPGLSWSRGRSEINQDFGAGSATITLRNGTGIFTPFNSSSPIYGQMIPGRQIKVEAVHNSVTYPVIYGRLASISQSEDGAFEPTVTLTLEEEFGRMSMSRYNSRESFLTGGSVDDILRIVLFDYGGITLVTVLDVATQTIDTFWNPPGGSYLDAAKSAAKQELGGYYFIQRDGKHRFGNREARSREPLHATWTGAYAHALSISQADFIDEVVHKRAGLDVSGDTEAIFNDFPPGRQIAIGATDPKNTFHGDYIASARNVVQPVAGLDYIANTLADGAGADVTNQVSVSAWKSYGGGFEITMDNASGAMAYLMLFQVRGQPIRQSDDRREISVTDPSSPVRNQALRDEFAFNDDADAIKGYALFRLYAGSSFYPRHLRIARDANTDAEAINLLGLEIEKRIHLTNTVGPFPTSIDDDYFVESIRGQFLQGGLMMLDLDLWHEIAALGNFFRISGAAGADQNYSQIVAATATAGDRIRF